MLKAARTPGKLPLVPNQPRKSNPHRSVRFEDEDWADGLAAAEVTGAARGRILNEFLRWYLRRPGAKLPKRPTEEQINAIVQARLDHEAEKGSAGE